LSEHRATTQRAELAGDREDGVHMDAFFTTPEDDGYEDAVMDGEAFLDWLLGDDAWDQDPEA
jgi:hypothetical protein